MKKKIGIVVARFPLLSETFVMNQIISFIELGFEVKIFSHKYGNSDIIHKKIYDNNLLEKKVYPVSAPSSILKRLKKLITTNFLGLSKKTILGITIANLNNRLLYSSFIFYKYSLFRNITDIDIFIVHFGNHAIELANLKKNDLLQNKKLIVFFHGYDLEYKDILINRKIYNTLFNVADLFVVNTPYLYDILIETNPSISHKVIIQPVGLSLPIGTTNITTEKYKDFTVVFCGRLLKWKGPDNVIKIANILVNKHNLKVQFKLIGDGEMLNDLKKLIKIYKLDEYVELLGPLSQESVFDVYQKSHVFILPGIHDPKTGRAETQGLVIQEAQYFKLPVLVSDAGGMKYGLLNEKTGFVLKQNDNESFAEKIVLLYENDSLREIMGENGNKFVKENYDIKNITQNLIRHFNTNEF